jgi:hypothetical protein
MAAGGLEAGEQNQGTLAVRVVGKDAGQHVVHPVDHAYPVGHEIGPVGGQQGEIGDELGGDADRGEVAAVACGFCDDVGVAGVGLGLASVGADHAVHGAAGHVDDLMAVGRQQS